MVWIAVINRLLPLCGKLKYFQFEYMTMDIEVQASVFIKRVHGILKISVDSVFFVVKAQAFAKRHLR